MEAFIAGDEEKVEKLVEWCRRGPPLAKVEKVVVERTAELAKIESFASKINIY